MSHEKACSIILEGRGTHFDPDVVDAFFDNEKQFYAFSAQQEASTDALAIDPAVGSGTPPGTRLTQSS
jgi:putative two-component system response regulator